MKLNMELVAAGPIVAVSNDNDPEDVYPSDPEVSEDGDVISPSAGIDYLNIGGNQWGSILPLIRLIHVLAV